MKPQPAHCLHPADMLTSHPSFKNNFQRYLLKLPCRVSPSNPPRPRLLERSVLTHCFHFLNSHSSADFLRSEFCTHSSSEIVVCRSISPSSSWGRTGANSTTLPPASSSFQNVAQCLSRARPRFTLFTPHPTPPYPQAPARTQTWCKPETWASRRL